MESTVVFSIAADIRGIVARFLLLLVIVTVAISFARAGDETNGIHNLQLQGNRAFSADGIREALENDVVIRRLVSLGTDPLRLTEEAANRVLAAYQSFGFLDAAVDFADDKQRSTLTISEGPQYHRGEVQVHGLDPASARQVQAMLTKTSREFRPPIFAADGKISKKMLAIWKPGAATGDLEATVVQARSDVALWLEHQGYWFPNFEVQTSKDAASGKVHLLVTIADRGEQLPISEVLIDGLSRHTTQQVLDHLQLPQPLTYSEAHRLNIIESLEDTGRFRSVAVSPEIPFGPGQAMPLTVRVEEFEEVPPLNEALTTEQEAAIKLAHWLNHWHESGDDLVIHVTHYPGQMSDESLNAVFALPRFLTQMVLGDPLVQESHAELTLCPAGGGLLSMQSLSLQGTLQPRRTLVISKDLSGIHFEGTGRAFRTEALESGCTLALTLQSWLSGSQFDSAYNASFEFGSGRRPELGVCLRFPPAAVLSEIEHLQVSPHDDRIMLARFHGWSAVAEFERETGRLLRMQFGDEDMNVSVETRPGALAQQLPEVGMLFEKSPVHQESDAIFELGRMLFLQYAAELASSGHPDDGGLIVKLLESPAWDKLASGLSATNPEDRFLIPAPGTKTAAVDQSLLGKATAAYAKTHSSIAQGHLTIQVMKPGDTLSDTEIVKRLATFIGDTPELDAISRFAVSYLRSLTDNETERLTKIIEQGEIFGFGKGLSLWPILTIVRSSLADDPVVLRELVLAIVWQSSLKHHVRRSVVVDENGESHVRLEFGKPAPAIDTALPNLLPDEKSTPVKNVSATNSLDKSIDESIRENQSGAKVTGPDERFNKRRDK